MRSLEALTAIERARVLALAQTTKTRRKSTSALPITPIDRNRPLELSFAQQRLWFLSQFEGASRANHIAGGLRLKGDLDRRALRLALNQIVARHEALRTTFSQVEGRLIQVIGSAEIGFRLEEEDLRQAEDAEGELRRLAEREAREPFDLERGPLIRGRLARLGEEDHALLVTMHHIVSDGWSMGILVNELSELYRAYRSGEAARLPELPIQYADYAAWQQRWLSGEVLGRQAEYWKRTLAGAPALLELPADRARPAEQDYAGGGVGVELGEGLTGGLKALSRRHGTTLYMTLLAGWAALLSRLSGQDEVVIGTPVANRTRTEVEGLIGFFVNTLALRIDLSGRPSVGELLGRVKARTLEAQQNQGIPFEQVVEIVQPPRSLSHAPIFQAMFVWQNAPSGRLELPGLRVSALGTLHTAAIFDILISLGEASEGIAGVAEYARALYESVTVERWLGYWRRLLEGMVADEEAEVERLPLMGEAERRQMVKEWNATETEYPKEKLVHELFEEQVKRSPDAVAVVFGDEHLSYSELDARANRLANYLLVRSLRVESRVGLSLERSVEMAVAVLGILKAGAACVPLDPSYPPDRLQYMVRDAGVEWLVTAGAAAEQLPAGGAAQLLRLDYHFEEIELETSTPPPVTIDAQNLFYVIYTSGSTGRPKGVALSHAAIANLIGWDGTVLSPQSRTLQFSSLNFDASFHELFLTWASGGTVVLITREEQRDPLALSHEIRCQSVERLNLPAAIIDSVLEELAATGCHTVRELISTAEQMQIAPRWWSWLEQEGCRVWNHYGPSETQVITAWQAWSGSLGNLSHPPIGRPISNCRAYVLNVELDPAPIGVGGELYLGGIGVARGYLNQPGQTAERFVPDRNNTIAGSRLYRTGDLARYFRDGGIEYLGRIDQQVKIRGFRIEPGEIEARLGEHPAVREAVVVASGESDAGKRLTAYYTGEETGAEALRAHLSSALPEYMVPAAYVHLEALPLTPNGKLDRRALPIQGDEAYARRGYEAPVGEIETRLAEIWAELLKVERVGRQDDFFELGGHSLLAVRALSRLRQDLGVEAALADIFRHPSLAEFARSVEGARRSVLPPIRRKERGGRLALSFAQQRLWFISRMEGASRAYHIAAGLRLSGKLDRDALARALNKIGERHEALRTTFSMRDGEPIQVIGPAEQGFELLEVDLREAEEVEAELLRQAEQEAETPFDLARGPLARGRLLRLGEDEHALLVTMHHIVADGWSMGILIEEFSALYSGYREGKEAELPELSIQYADYAAWQREWLSGEALERQAEYWRRTLAGAPALLELPADRARPAAQDYAGGSVGVELEEELTRGLKELSRRRGTTLHMTLLAGWAALLSRLSGQSEVVIGTPVANRTRSEVEGMIGFFVNTLALRIDVGGGASVVELLRRVRERALEGHRHQELPFEQVVELAQPRRSLSYEPIFQAMFAWQNAPSGRLELPGLRVSALGTPHTTAKFDIELSLAEEGLKIAGGLGYARALYESVTVERWLGYWRRLLEGMVADEEAEVERLPLMGEEERRQLLEEWNATEADYPREKCVHQLFEEQAERRPDSIALIHEDSQLSYAELNARANRLALHLRALGVRPGMRVVLLLERSIDLVTAQLATLISGAAYVPIDPSFPDERQVLIVSDCASPVVLTTQRMTLPEALSAIRVNLDDWSPLAMALGTAPPISSSQMTAYVMYTSGSTGSPKGVMAPHRAIGRLVLNCGYADFNAGDRVAFAANPGFDAATMEVWAPLLNGGCLVVIDHDCLLEPTTFAQALKLHAVSILWMTAGLLNQYASASPEAFGGLRYLIAGGDVLDPGVIAGLLRNHSPQHLVNGYGPTETTTFAITHEVREVGEGVKSIPLGRPIGNTQVYLLDANQQPVPIGVSGEIYIGGDGVAEGYHNRPDMAAERFLPNPFGREPGLRLYKTGDLGRWLPEGEIEFLGRNDFQVKVRGFRIEPGEIEARLAEHPAVREVVVLPREEGEGGKRLVAYYTGVGVGAEELRSHLTSILPEYMAPAAYVRLESLPLTQNGKLDRRALPTPEGDAYLRRDYEPPVGETEIKLARIWADLLKIERVGRHDNFFELGGHSLLVMTMVERMRREGLMTDIRSLFTAPTLGALAEAVGGDRFEIEIPPNLIPTGCEAITPEMLPLVKLTHLEIESIVAVVSGGAANVQDIYPLTALQEGILFHHLIESEGDVYLMHSIYSFDTRARLERFLQALQSVIDRHDILRTAVLWEGLPEPVQVVWRQAALSVEEVNVEPGIRDVAEELFARFDPRRYRIDVRQAPLTRVCITHDASRNRWLMLHLFHHLLVDHTTSEILMEEVQAHLLGREDHLPEPLPFRNFVAQARLSVSREEHEAFFRSLLGDVDEPTAPYGMIDVQGDGSGIREVWREVDARLASRLRRSARALGVSAASLCHLAWAKVLSRVSGRDDVVFGTVLFGRMQGSEGIDRVPGMFINTLPMRIRISGESVVESVRQTHVLLAQLLRHEHAPLALAQRCSAVEAPAPLFSSFLNYRYKTAAAAAASPDEEAFSAWEGIEILSSEDRSNYPLGLSVDDLGEGFVLSAQVQPPVEPDRICDYMHTALEQLAQALEQAPETPVRKLSVLPDSERHQLLVEWNETRRPYPQDRRIHELFREQAERTPDQIALAGEREQVSYRELDWRSKQLAAYLQMLGVGPEVVVGVCLERSVEMVVAVIGVLKAGGAYLPLDPEYPLERSSYMLDDAGVGVVLTEHKLEERLPAFFGQTICLDLEWERISEESKINPECGPESEAEAENLAYVIYTSGSTGRPKGVMVAHKGLCNLVEAQKDAFKIENQSRVLQFASLNFDASVSEIFSTLTAGGSLHVYSRERLMPGSDLLRVLREELITTVTLPPTVLAALSAEELSHLQTIIAAGEACTAEIVERWYKGRRFLDAYGPTEATVCASIGKCEASSHKKPTIGRPIANTRLYILDREMRPAPLGVGGELYISGLGLARGYLGSPELTAERFVPNLFGLEGGERLYRTGDVCRYLSDGSIGFIGRADDQVKMRGYRIELGEIETMLNEHPLVRQSVVVVSGDKRLLGYVVGEEGATTAELKRHLREKLPDYMVPEAILMLEEMPVTANGKLDRKRLPSVEGADRQLEREYVSARTPVEEMVVGIFEEVLKLDRVGIHDNFFEIGGHSLLATQVISRVRSIFGVEVGVGSVFKAPTIEGLSRTIEKAIDDEEKVEAPQLVRAPRGGRLPLSFAQQRLWFIDQLGPGDVVYNIPGGLKLYGDLDIEALERVINEIVRRHEALRTRFEVVEDEPVQVIDQWEPRRLEVEDLTGLTQGDKADEANRIMDEESGTGFDLRRGPLYRVKILKLGAREHILLYTMHHIVSDGWSMGILIREVGELYSAFQRGETSPLPELPIQYADYAVWQREWLQGAALEKELSYWKRQLAGVSRLELPTDKPRPPIQTNRGAVESLALTAEQTMQLKELSRREGATLFMTLLAGFQILLGRYSGSEDLAIGTDIANRNRAETEGLIGFFVNQLVLRTDLSGEPDFRQLLGRVREVCLGAYGHQDLPFEKLVEELRPERSLSYTPLFQVSFSMNAATGGEGAWLPEMGLEPAEGRNETTKYDLTLTLSEIGGVVKGGVQYNADLFEAVTIERMIGHLVVLLEDVARRSEVRIRRLQILGEEERMQILEEWNRTEKDYPGERCLHELFEGQAKRSPEAIAVASGDEQVTYRELNERANRLAHYLMRLGIGPEQVVGICLQRSVELVTSLLGVLKAGGAYLPLDPDYPGERLEFMLRDAAAEVLITDRALAERFNQESLRLLCLDEESTILAQESEDNPRTRTTPHNLAYLIYTSGSSGRPKGVLTPHCALVNYLCHAIDDFELTAEDRVLQFASISFDAAAEEIYPTLLSGARLVLRSGEMIATTSLFLRGCEQEAVSVLDLPTSFWEQLTADLSAAELSLPECLRLVIIGGEKAESSMLRRWHEQVSDRVRLVNTYGPTEATIVATRGELSKAASVVIGHPVANVGTYLLDQDQRPEPVGVAGELYIAGAGLARGYLNNAEQTAERFIPHLYSDQAGQRLYRSGDVGRRLSDGQLEYLKRTDQQVKLRGYRIELGEIEIVLSGYPGVRQAAVVARADSRGEKRLVGYVVGEGEISAVELRGFLQGRLPEYMVPGAWVLMEALPLTPNGKVDRKALPDPGFRVIDPQSAAPRTPVEEILAGIFTQALNLERIGIEENFFDLGGHSLLATRVISQVKKAFEVELALRALFESPTVKGLARQVEKALQQGQALAELPLRRADRSRDLPLSFAQQRLWLIHQIEPESALYNMPMTLRLESEVDVAALERSLQEIVRRHESLRTSFRSERGVPVQIINADWRIALPVIDLSSLSADERLSAAERLAADEAERPFDLSCGQLLRSQLLRLDELDHVLIINKHHIVGDEWSEGIFIGELAVLYEAYCRGEQSPLPELEIQYADFSVWQREWLTGPVLEQQRNHWKSRLGANFQELQLPTDRPRPQAQTHNGEACHFKFSAELSGAIRNLCRAANSTLYMVLLAAFKALLYRYTGQDVITVGSPIANRNRVEVEKLIGFFVNTLVLSSDVSDNPEFMELIGRVRETALDAYTYQDFPFDLLVEELRPRRRTNYSPLITVIFETRDMSGTKILKLPKLALSSFYSGRQPAYFDLTLSLSQSPDGIDGYFEYNTDLFDADTIQEMKQRLESLLEAVTKDSGLRLLDIPLSRLESIEGDQESLDPEIQSAGQDYFVFD